MGPKTARLLTSDEWAARATDAYSEDVVAEFCARRTKLSLATEEPVVLNTAQLMLATAAGDGAKILDFGGGAGTFGVTLRRAMPNLFSRYLVVETFHMAEASRREEIPGIEFSSEIPDAKFDVVISSGTLQCLDKPIEQLKRLVDVGARHLVLARNLFSNSQRFIHHRAPLFNHGSGPIPPGFKNIEVDHYLQSVDIGEARRIVQSRYDISFICSNASGHPMRDDAFIGEDWFCSIKS